MAKEELLGVNSPEVWADFEKISEEENNFLTSPFTEEEIYLAIKSMGANKVPGPDGFSMSFYQQFWKILKSDMLILFEEFYKGNLDISKINRATICLIPKKDNASLISEYKPINLLNCSYEIFSKLLANRLQVVLNRIISPSQCAYLKNRIY